MLSTSCFCIKILFSQLTLPSALDDSTMSGKFKVPFVPKIRYTSAPDEGSKGFSPVPCSKLCGDGTLSYRKLPTTPDAKRIVMAAPSSSASASSGCVLFGIVCSVVYLCHKPQKILQQVGFMDEIDQDNTSTILFTASPFHCFRSEISWWLEHRP